jgi:hypothetical protein
VHDTKEPPAGVFWKKWQHRRQTADEVAHLVNAHPAADIAIVLGGGSGGLVDVETDGRYGERALRALGLPLPPTAAWESLRGLHRLHRSLSRVPTRIGLRRQLDVLAAGHYTVIPPCGGRQWLTPGGLADIAPLPDAWVDLLSRRPRHQSVDPGQDPGPGLQQVGLIGPTCFTSGSALRAIERTPEFFPAVGRILGLPFLDVGRPFRRILPGHEERHASASVWRRDDGTYHYHDFHGRTRVEWFTLADVYAARVTGTVRPLRGPELATWKLRLLVQAGLAVPAPVALPLLPPSADIVARRVYEGFRLLLACKWLYAPGEPTAFSWRFAAAWSGVSQRAAGAALHQLLRAGIIRTAGTWKHTTLFLPGVRSAQDM